MVVVGVVVVVVVAVVAAVVVVGIVVAAASCFRSRRKVRNTRGVAAAAAARRETRFRAHLSPWQPIKHYQRIQALRRTPGRGHVTSTTPLIGSFHWAMVRNTSALRLALKCLTGLALLFRRG